MRVCMYILYARKKMLHDHIFIRYRVHIWVLTSVSNIAEKFIIFVLAKHSRKNEKNREEGDLSCTFLLLCILYMVFVDKYDVILLRWLVLDVYIFIYNIKYNSLWHMCKYRIFSSAA